MGDLSDDDRAALAALPMLHARLMEAARLHDQGGRDGALTALGALHEFINGIPSFRDAGLLRPLRALAAGMMQLGVGNVSPLLAPAVAQNRHPMPLDRQALQVAAAVALEEAMWWGDSKTRAAGRVADALQARGYRLGREEITAATVINWRKELNKTDGCAGEMARAVWHDFKAALQQREQRPPPNTAQAVAAVEGALSAIPAMSADAGWGETTPVSPR